MVEPHSSSYMDDLGVCEWPWTVNGKKRNTVSPRGWLRETREFSENSRRMHAHLACCHSLGSATIIAHLPRCSSTTNGWIVTQREHTDYGTKASGHAGYPWCSVSLVCYCKYFPTTGTVVMTFDDCITTSSHGMYAQVGLISGVSRDLSKLTTKIDYTHSHSCERLEQYNCWSQSVLNQNGIDFGTGPKVTYEMPTKQGCVDVPFH
ncbi:hypothetical protein F4823DRAFT_575399 [Ustulina deusta]|nr:hypothetical protein F4823DRAFT_575399 [Ustulina deusta]